MSQLSSPQRIIRFREFDVDPRSGELRKRGRGIKLQLQPFQVLQALLEHPGEVVTREELQKRIWPADTHADFDQGLNNAVKKLREALLDDAEKPRFIQTLSKRGYRFISPVENLGIVANTSAVSRAAPTILDSIVVLPFTSMSADPVDEFFADGMAEEIINALAQIEQLHVVARTSAFSFKSKYFDIRAIGKRLNVRTVLLGSIRRAGNRLRITGQLGKAEDGYHLWSERYDREMKDIFVIQDEIARSIVDGLKVELTGNSQEPLVKAGTKNLEAYQLYLKGRALLPRRGSALPRALECFERAVRLDPNYAQAWAGVADSYTTLAYYRAAHPGVSMPKGIEAARRAVALDPLLAEAHTALAMACLMDAWDKVEAERGFLRALELNPKYIQARDWYAMFYLQFAEGRLEEGVAQAKQAVESDPLSSYANAVFGLACSWASRHAQAVKVLEHAVELDPESFLARYCLSAALYLSGRFEEAVVVGELAAAMSGQNSWAMVVLGATMADWGKSVEARAVYTELLGRSRRRYVSPAILALTASAAYIEDAAIRHAHDAFKIRDPMAPVWFSTIWPASARLRADPRFAQIDMDMGWLRK